MKKNRVDKVCPICNASFEVKMSKKDAVYCSYKCSRIGLRKNRQLEIEQKFNAPIKDIIYHFYYDENLGVKQAAKKIGVSDRVLWDWMDEFQIERRDRSIAVALQWENNNKRKTKQSQRMKSMLDNGTIDNRGDNNPAKRASVREKIRKSKIGEKNAWYNAFGDKNPNWRGGKITYRGKGWVGIREQVKRRDGKKCRRCGSKKQLQVHHIIPYRKTQDNSLDNLVTLCASCHMAVEHKGATWD